MIIELELNEYQITALEKSLLHFMRDKNHEINCNDDLEDNRNVNIKKLDIDNARIIYTKLKNKGE